TEFRKEVRRLTDIANKRIKRLEERDWGDSPALRALKEEGIAKFSVKGKTHQEVQNMAARLIKFLNAETSTVRGAIEDIKETAQITGITYQSVKELKQKAKKFFELASKIKQYLKSQQDTAAALNYRQIWNQINQYVAEQEIDLSSAEVSVESLLEDVDEILARARGKKFEPMDGFDGFEMI
ncbi:hypothetical protein, partial [Enterobacter hormaechei]